MRGRDMSDREILPMIPPIALILCYLYISSAQSPALLPVAVRFAFAMIMRYLLNVIIVK